MTFVISFLLKGKGPSIWDVYSRQPGKLPTSENGDFACDSYNRLKDDIDVLKRLGVKSYRFSLSWTRILPNSFTTKINPAGVSYYNNLIDQLLLNDIQPLITLHHFDLPWDLQLIGGWSNPLTIDHFVNYARVVFDHFGDRVKMWTTINEPKMLCMVLYGHDLSFTQNLWGIGEYLCGHTLIMAHASVYRMYDVEFKQTQRGRVGLVVDDFWYEPATDKPEDIEAAERKLQFTVSICGFSRYRFAYINCVEVMITPSDGAFNSLHFVI